MAREHLNTEENRELVARAIEARAAYDLARRRATAVGFPIALHRRCAALQSVRARRR